MKKRFGVLLAALLVAGQAVAGEPLRVDEGTISVFYEPNSLWSSGFFTPKFKHVQSDAGDWYSETMSNYLRTNGYAVGADGIGLAVSERYAGPAGGYRTPQEGKPAANPLEVLATVGFATVMAKYGMYSGSQVGMAAAANNLASTANMATTALKITSPDVPDAPGAAADAQMVVIQLCSIAGKRCVSSVALSREADVSLDTLREAGMRLGIARALGLKSGG